MKHRDIHESLKAIIREAVKTDRNLPSNHCRPAGYRSSAPDYVRDVQEAYGYDMARIGRITPAAEQISRMYMVEDAMMSPLLSPRDRLILWAVAARTPWKKICGSLGMGRTWINKLHDRALVTFGVELANLGTQRRAA